MAWKNKAIWHFRGITSCVVWQAHGASDRQELRLGDKIVKGLSKEYEFILK